MYIITKYNSIVSDGISYVCFCQDRIFIENIGAVKELCKVTDHLETRITHIEVSWYFRAQYFVSLLQFYHHNVIIWQLLYIEC